MQAGPQPPRRAVGWRIHWTHRIRALFVRQPIFLFRDRRLRRIRLLLIPHWTLLRAAHPTQISRRSAARSTLLQLTEIPCAVRRCPESYSCEAGTARPRAGPRLLSVGGPLQFPNREFPAPPPCTLP